MMNRIKNNRAFTIIELLVVIAILGVLVLLAAPRFLGYTEDVKIVQIQNDIKTAETTVGAELVRNESYLNDWDIVSNEDLQGYLEESKLFDREGLTNEIDLDNIYYELPSNLSNSNLKGQFYANKGGDVYYYDENFKGRYDDNTPEENEPEEKEMNISLDESSERTQTHVLTIPNLSQLDNIESDNGEIEVLNIDGDKITIKVENGTLSRQELVNGEYIPADTKFVTAQTSPNYSQDGYTGQLEEYVHSGSYIPADSKTQMATRPDPVFSSCSQHEGDSGFLPYQYNSGGYSGSLPYVGCTDTGNGPQLNYSGTVTRPESDTRVFRYQGEVTKPESDTRVYENYYKYSITVNYK